MRPAGVAARQARTPLKPITTCVTRKFLLFCLHGASVATETASTCDGQSYFTGAVQRQTDATAPRWRGGYRAPHRWARQRRTRPAAVDRGDAIRRFERAVSLQAATSILCDRAVYCAFIQGGTGCRCCWWCRHRGGRTIRSGRTRPVGGSSAGVRPAVLEHLGVQVRALT